MPSFHDVKYHREKGFLGLTKTLNVDTFDPNTLIQTYFIEEAPIQNLPKSDNAQELNLVRRLVVNPIKFCTHLKKRTSDLPQHPCELIQRQAETTNLQVVAKRNKIKDENVHSVVARKTTDPRWKG